MPRPKATWLDRTIGWSFPGWGMRRAQARGVMQALRFDAGENGPWSKDWITPAGSADSDSRAFMATIRQRSRDLVRNNPYAARAADVKVAHTIGTGITAELSSKRATRFWEAFAENCDADRHTDLNGIFALAERCRFESGEALIRMMRGGGDIRDNPIPTELRVLEPDYLDRGRDTLTRGANGSGNLIRDGIEYENGVPVAYWLFPEHPGDYWTTPAFESERVPAEDVIHIFRKLRPGQARGWSDLAPVVLRLRGLDNYDEAISMRAQIEACLAVFVTTPGAGGAADLLGEKSALTDSAGNRLETVYPGMIGYGPPGRTFDIHDPHAGGSNFGEYQRFGLRAVAAGTGIPYELLTGDLSEVNYSTSRVSQVDFRRRLEQEQWLLWVPRVCNRIARRFKRDLFDIRGASAGGMGIEFDWTPPRFELIDPLKETQADLEAVLAGFETWEEIVRRRGWNAAQQLEVIRKWQELLRDQGIVLKSDAQNQILSAATAREPMAVDDNNEPETRRPNGSAS